MIQKDEMISVIVPVYKVEECLLRRSIESILQQTYSNLELLLIDDGSPDQCGDICDEYSEADARVRVFHIPNGGVSAARNVGLENCEGTYISFVDSDDYIEESFLESLYMTMLKTKADYVKAGCQFVAPDDERIKITNLPEKKIVKRETALENLFYLRYPFDCIEVTAIWGTLYKAECLKNIRFNTGMKIGEDFAFSFQVLQQVSKAVYLSTNGYAYTVRDDSAMRGGFNKKNVETIHALKQLIKDAYGGAYYDGVVSRCENIGIVILLTIPIEKKYSIYRKQVKKFLLKYRWATLKNKKSRKKVKASLLLSYLGFDNMQRLFEWKG